MSVFVTLQAGAPFVRGVYFEQVLCHCLVDFDAVFSAFFRRDCPFGRAR